jgi:hypothetical protein
MYSKGINPCEANVCVVCYLNWDEKMMMISINIIYIKTKSGTLSFEKGSILLMFVAVQYPTSRSEAYY